MTWLIIEAALAVAILIGIVWWTLPRRPKKPDDDAPGDHR
jgi:hypothetical protein